MRPRLFGLLAILCAVLAVVVAAPLTAFAGQPQHGSFDDSRYPHTFGSHGDPTTGVPSSSSGDSGYYYLNVFVGSGGTVHAEIWTTSGRWRIDIDSGLDKTPLKQVIWNTTPNETSLSGLTPGEFIRVRFANESGRTSTDHGSAYATAACALIGAPNDTSRVSSTATCSPDPTLASAAPAAQSQPASSGGAPAPPTAQSPSKSKVPGCSAG
jgi:hypothetical protein